MKLTKIKVYSNIDAIFVNCPKERTKCKPRECKNCRFFEEEKEEEIICTFEEEE